MTDECRKAIADAVINGMTVSGLWSASVRDVCDDYGLKFTSPDVLDIVHETMTEQGYITYCDRYSERQQGA